MDVISLDLRDLSAMSSPPFRGRAVYLIAKWDDRVLGAGFLPACSTVGELADEIAHLLQNDWQVRTVTAAVGQKEQWQSAARRNDGATVGVCTRMRPAALARCLSALQLQLTSRDELIVVDNAPNPSTRELAEEHGARWFHERRVGSSWARNRILTESTRNLIAFIDDDCIPDPQWLTSIVQPLTDPDIGVVTGPVVAESYARTWPRRMDEVYPYHRGWLPIWFFGGTDSDLSPYDSWRVGTGASMAWRTDLLKLIRGFDPALGAGTKVGGGEDLDAFTRAFVAGATIVYEPAALVRHPHPETRRAMRRQLRNYFRCSGAQVAKAWLEDRRTRPVKMLLREWAWELRWAARELLNVAFLRPSWPVGPLVAHPLLAASGAIRFIRHRRRLRVGWPT